MILPGRALGGGKRAQELVRALDVGLDLTQSVEQLLYRVTITGRVRAEDDPVRDQAEREPVGGCLAVYDRELDVGVERGVQGQQPGGERLALPGLRADQDARPQQQDGHEPAALVQAERGRLPDRAALEVEQRRRARRDGQRVGVGDPQHDAALAVIVLGEVDLRHLHVEPGGQHRAGAHRVGEMLTVRQVDDDPGAVAVAGDGRAERDDLVRLGRVTQLGDVAGPQDHVRADQPHARGGHRRRDDRQVGRPAVVRERRYRHRGEHAPSPPRRVDQHRHDQADDEDDLAEQDQATLAAHLPGVVDLVAVLLADPSEHGDRGQRRMFRLPPPRDLPSGQLDQADRCPPGAEQQVPERADAVERGVVAGVGQALACVGACRLPRAPVLRDDQAPLAAHQRQGDAGPLVDRNGLGQVVVGLV